MASLLATIQERALSDQAEVNPMWPKRLQPELICKIAQFVPANLPVYDVARFELWKKGETMSKAVIADALWRKDGLQDGLFPTDGYFEGDYFTKRWSGAQIGQKEGLEIYHRAQEADCHEAREMMSQTDFELDISIS